MEAILRIYSKLINKKGSTSVTVKSSAYNYFIEPFYAGILGFTTFMFFIFLAEMIIYLTGINHAFVFGSKDVLMASIGFILPFISRIFKNLG